MKIIINKNTLKDSIIYINDIVNGIKNKLNSTKEEETRKKMISTLMIFTTVLTGGTVIGANVIDNIKNGKEEETVIEIPIEPEDIDIEPMLTNPGPILAPTTETSLDDYIVNPIETTYEIENKQNNLTPDNLEDALKLYTDIFEVRYDLVSPIIYNKIYSNPDFYTDFTVDNTRYVNLHEAIFFEVLDIVYNPGKYGYNNDDLKSNKDWKTDLSAEELTFIFSEFFDINPFFVQVIEYTECGTRMDSYDYLENNNPAGIGPHNKFRNKATGIIYLCYILKENYNITTESEEDDLIRISGTYCTVGTENWRNNSCEFYDKITKNGYLYYAKKYNDKEYVIEDITYDEYLNNKNINNKKDGI